MKVGDERMTEGSNVICLHVVLTPGFPSGSAGKESAFSARDLGLMPGLGRSPGDGKGSPLQYSDLQNSMHYVVHGLANNERLSLYFDSRWWRLDVCFPFICFEVLDTWSDF